jgi:hypothetical protein
MDNLISTVNYIVSRSTELKNKFTDASLAPVEFACIFCKTDKEYDDLINTITPLGKIVESPGNGFTYFLDKPINTVSGPLRFVKIRKPDSLRQERGDADFNTNYQEFKKKYGNNPKYELVKRETFEYLRLSDPAFDVLACFSDIPKSKTLEIDL